jgi:hypothetical protein
MATLSFIIEAQNRAGQTIKEVESQVKGLEGKVKDMQPAFQKMALKGTAAFTAISLGAKNAIDSASEFQGISTDFSRMTDQIGIDGDKLIDKLNEVSMGTVSNTDLMLSVNKAMALGVGNNIDDITKLMEIARLKGRALGLDTTQAFNDIVTGIGRGSPLILDNLGIIIKQEAAQKAYAKQLGKTVDEMTDAEKSQSIFNAVMESGTKDLELAGELSLSFGEKMQQIRKETADASVSLGESLLPVIETLADIIIPLIKNISKFAEENQTLVRNIIIATMAITGIIAVVGTLGLLLPSLIAGFGAFGAILSFIMSPIGLVVGAIAGLIAVGVLLWKNWEEISDKATMIWNNILNLIKGILKKIGDFIYDYISFWVGLIDMFLNIFGISVKDIQNAIESMMTYIKNIFSTVSEEVSKIWNGLWGGIKDMVNSAVNFMKPIIDGFVSWFQDKFDVIGDIVSSVKGAIDSIGSTIGGAVSSVSNIGKSILGGYQFGIDSVPRTGMYMLHKGESVSPAGSSNSIVVNINGGYYMSERAAEDIGDKIIERLKREVKL